MVDLGVLDTFVIGAIMISECLMFRLGFCLRNCGLCSCALCCKFGFAD